MLYALGSNSDGQLGIGHRQDVDTWQVCEFEQDEIIAKGWRVLQLASSKGSSLAWCTRGDEHRLYATGEICTMWSAHHDLFVRVPCEPLIKSAKTQQLTVKHIAAAWDCFFVVLHSQETDVILALGQNNTFGLLGSSAKNGWVHVIEIGSCARLSHTIVAFDCDHFRVQTLTAGVRHVMAVICADQHAALIGWGDARHGQLGLPLPEPRVYGGLKRISRPPSILAVWDRPWPHIQLALGMQHSLISIGERNAMLWMLGSSRYGQTDPSSLPGTVTSSETMPLGTRGIRISDSLCIACNWHTSLIAFRASNQVIGIGNNQQKQSGDSSLRHQVQSLKAGSEHGAILTNQHRLIAWGWNEHGNLGKGSECMPPTELSDNVMNAWLGYGTTWALFRD